MFLLFFLSLGQSSHVSFLQEAYSSISTLGSGVEDLSKSISDLSSDLSSSILSVDSSLESSVVHISSTSSSLFVSRINELENELAKLNSQIAETTKEISLLSEHCEEFSDCTGCTSTSSCVWCLKGRCVEGSSSGPFQNECSEFSYKECENSSCQDYDTCNSCVAEGCGWCESTSECFKSEADDSGSCPDSDYYHIDGNTCMEEADTKGTFRFVDSYVYSNPTQSPNQLSEDLESFVVKSTEKVIEIQAEIDLLRYSQELLEKQADLVNSIEVQGFSSDPITGLADKIETAYLSEKDASRASEEQFLADAEAEIVAYSTLVIDQNTLLVLEEIQETTDDFSEDINELEEELIQSISEIEEDLNSTDETTETDEETTETDEETTETDEETTETDAETTDTDEETSDTDATVEI